MVPEPDHALPFHKNIRIHDNRFDSADSPILYAYATCGLRFENNRIFRSPAAEKWYRKATGLIRLEHCTQVTAKDNLFVGPFTLERYEVTESENLNLE